MAEYQYVKAELADFIGTITICNPPMNYFNVEMICELVDILKYYDSIDECRVSVLQAEGDVFCAGGEFGKGEHGYDV